MAALEGRFSNFYVFTKVFFFNVHRISLFAEEERRRVQQAHFEAHVRGRGVPRAGEIFALL